MMNGIRKTTALLIGLFALSTPKPQAEILFSDTFAAPDGIRPKGWKIVEENLDPQLFWKLRNEQFFTGNGDNIPIPDGYSFAIVDAPNAAKMSKVPVPRLESCSSAKRSDKGCALSSRIKFHPRACRACGCGR